MKYSYNNKRASVAGDDGTKMQEKGSNMQLALPSSGLFAGGGSGPCALTEPENEEIEGTKKQRMDMFTFNATSAEAASVEQPRRPQ